jgi:hypothetical protein
MEIIGTTQVEKMQYPMTRKQTDTEKELFEWPSQNQRLGPDFGQFLRPIESDPAKSQYGLLPLPWNCHVIVIKGGERNISTDINRLPNAVFANDVATAQTTIAALDFASVIFVVGTRGNLPPANAFPDKDVRLVPLSSLQQPANGNAGNDARKKMTKELKSLKVAIELGAAQLQRQAAAPAAIY